MDAAEISRPRPAEQELLLDKVGPWRVVTPTSFLLALPSPAAYLGLLCPPPPTPRPPDWTPSFLPPPRQFRLPTSAPAEETVPRWLLPHLRFLPSPVVSASSEP